MLFNIYFNIYFWFQSLVVWLSNAVDDGCERSCTQYCMFLNSTPQLSQGCEDFYNCPQCPHAPCERMFAKCLPGKHLSHNVELWMDLGFILCFTCLFFVCMCFIFQQCHLCLLFELHFINSDWTLWVLNMCYVLFYILGLSLCQKKIIPHLLRRMWSAT